MWNMIWPIALLVFSNSLYNICAKSTPANANTFLSLSVTYLVAAAVSLTVFFTAMRGDGLLSQLKTLNWTAPVLGLVLTGLEFSYICAFRAGWKMSNCSLTANLCLACVLVFVGVLLYKETITLRQLVGMAVCGAGLFLMNR